MEAKLALEDGTVFTGRSCGADAERTGEVVFNTSMTGYQEILSDPSYCGQIVVMTYPLIGNYGINRDDAESSRPWVEGFVMREMSRRRSNFRANEDLDAFLARNGIPAIDGIDTRALTRRLRDKGALMGILSTKDLDDASLVGRAKAAPRLKDRNCVGEVTSRTPAAYREGKHSPFTPTLGSGEGTRFRVAALDSGIKTNILRYLDRIGCDVTVHPAHATAEQILADKPDGVFLSNGPGDPEALPGEIAAVRAVARLGVPVFGICLGHQLVALALGARTYKMKFGHHGGNHPVQDLATGKIEITTQNHGYAVEPDSLAGTGLAVTHKNLFDGTIEGLRHESLPVFTVQYHPEGGPGPHDSLYLFDRFRELLVSKRA